MVYSLVVLVYSQPDAWDVCCHSVIFRLRSREESLETLWRKFRCVPRIRSEDQGFYYFCCISLLPSPSALFRPSFFEAYTPFRFWELGICSITRAKKYYWWLRDITTLTENRLRWVLQDLKHNLVLCGENFNACYRHASVVFRPHVRPRFYMRRLSNRKCSSQIYTAAEEELSSFAQIVFFSFLYEYVCGCFVTIDTLRFFGVFVIIVLSRLQMPKKILPNFA